MPEDVPDATNTNWQLAQPGGTKPTRTTHAGVMYPMPPVALVQPAADPAELTISHMLRVHASAAQLLALWDAVGVLGVASRNGSGVHSMLEGVQKLRDTLAGKFDGDGDKPASPATDFPDFE